MTSSLKYILIILNLIVALQAAGQPYAIDSVCITSSRTYRVNGELGSTYDWILTDVNGDKVILPNSTGTAFSETDQTGTTIQGSEINISWPQTGLFSLALIQTSAFGCDSVQFGKINVYDPPQAYAGIDAIICPGNTSYTLSDATASDYHSLQWSSSGDGIFSDKNILQPTYTPGPNDILSGKALLTITALGKGSINTCSPAVSTLTLTIVKLEASLVSKDITCFGLSNGVIQVLGSKGGSGNYEYRLNNLDWGSSSEFDLLQKGTYEVWIRDATMPDCMTSLGSIEIKEPGLLSATTNHTDVTCLENDGTITLTEPKGGWGKYEFALNDINWQADGKFTALAPGNYEVWIRDADFTDCKILLRTVVIIKHEPLTAKLSKTDVTCFEGNDGIITVSDPKNGSGKYEFSLDGIKWQTELQFKDLNPDTYTVLIRDFDAKSCVETIGSLKVDEPARLQASTSFTNVKCFGANDGTISIINPTGGSGAFEFTVDGINWQSSQAFSGLKPDKYFVLMSDPKGQNCIEFISEITISEPPQMVATTASANISCFGANDGKITITNPKNGQSPYEFTIDDGTGKPITNTSGSFTGLLKGEYTAKMSDAKGCEQELGSFTIIEPEPLFAEVASTNTTCFGNDGTITITNPANSVSGLYEYSIDNGTSWSSNGSFKNLVPDTYVVKIRDASLTTCERTLDTKIITVPTPLMATAEKTNVTCYDSNDGTISILSKQGGSGLYEYSVDGTSWYKTEVFTGLKPGTYSLQMRDANSDKCFITVGDYKINEPDVLAASAQTFDVTCFGGDNGKITFSNKTGGSGAWEFSVDGLTWFTDQIQNLIAGIYTVRIRDANHPYCQVSMNPIEIKQPPKLTATVTPTNVTCFGGKDGAITISDPQNGVGPYAFSIDGGLNWQTDNKFTGLKASNYDLFIIQDANSCVATLQGVQVLQPEKLEAQAQRTNESLPGANNGTITIIGQKGGSNVYKYSLDGINWQPESFFSNLSPGNYVVYVGDFNVEGCMISIPVIILPAGTITAEYDKSDVTCFNGNDGSITFRNQAGASKYQYSITGGIVWLDNYNFSGLVAREYTLMIRDADNTENSVILGTIEIKQPDVLAATIVVTNETFNGAGDGKLTVTNTLGGSGQYQYSINGTAWINTPEFTGLISGPYDIYIRDKNATGCMITLQKVINPAGSLSAEVSQTNIKCKGDNSGIISVTNPSGASSYKYSTDNGKTWVSTPTIAGLTAGTYDVMIQDAANPANMAPLGKVVVSEPLLKLTVGYSGYEPPLCADGTGKLIVTASGGTPPYINTGKYTIPAGKSQTIIVIDKNGCQASLPFTMPNPKPIVATAVVNPGKCFADPGTVIITATGGTGTYFLNGKKLDASGKITVSSPTGMPYSFLIRDSNNCQADPIIGTMPGPDQLVVTVSPITPLCAGNSYTIKVTAKGGTPPYSGDGTFLRTTGTYTFTVTDALGCSADGSIDISVKDPPTDPVATATQPTCTIPTSTISVTSPVGANYLYSFDGGSYQSNPELAGMAPGTSHTVKVKDITSECESNTTSVKINPVTNAPLAPTAGVTVKPSCLISTATITVSSPSGDNYQYNIDGGAYQPEVNFAGLAPSSTHTIKVMDMNTGCESLPTSVKVDPVSSPPPAPVMVTSVKPNCDVSTATISVSSPLGINYQYSMDGGAYQSEIDFAGLAPSSSHTFRLKDLSTGCESSGKTVITDPMPANPPAPVASVLVSPTCNNPDGTVKVNSPAEGSGFEYSIDGEAYQTSSKFAGLIWGNHTIRVKSLTTRCESLGSIINVPPIPPAPVLTVASTEDCLCYNGNGSISFTITNAINGIYTINYDGGTFTKVNVAGGIAKVIAPAGNYNNLTISANGCVSLEGVNAIVGQPKQIAIVVDALTEIDLKSQKKGAIDIHASGGTGTFSYKWSNGATTEDIKNLSDGNYTVTVTDQNGCTRDTMLTIPVPNYPPVAMNDLFTGSCGIISGNLLADNGSGKDYDPENDTIFLDLTLFTEPLHGTITLNPDQSGAFEYTVNPAYSGIDTFRYVIYDTKQNTSKPGLVTMNILADFDSDGIPDDIDMDADGDGILNQYEVLAGQDWKTTDSDGDVHPNWLDIDSDNDGIPDNIEAQPTAGYIPPSGKDVNHNGIDDAYDPAEGGTQLIPVDTDNDGIPDFLDTDSDNDGVPDYIEGNDANSDGIADVILTGKDSDADGLDDAFDITDRCSSPATNMFGSNAPLQHFLPQNTDLRDWRNNNDDGDKWPTRFEDLNGDGDWSNDVTGHPGHPEYLWVGRNCELLIPEAFSPNGDNVHDFFQIYCIDDYPNARMYIFDALGNKLYEKDHYGNEEFWGSYEQAWWDGTTNNRVVAKNGGKVPPGTYYYVFQLGNGEVKKSYVFVSY